MAPFTHRLKREDCKRTKHDSVFSKWEILIGSSDWEDHSLGKDGVQRYRIHNLPNGCSCPGLYELGITAIPAVGGRQFRKQASEDNLVVYLGQADNVRTRLQQYGRFGGHLERESVNKNDRLGLFREIFSRGYSIIFRWAPMLDKKEAEKIESDLLSIFDYAWNKVGNGSCRRDEILSKLNSKPRSQLRIILKNLKLWKHPSFAPKAGIKIDSSVPIYEQKGFLLPRVFKFGKSQTRFVHENNTLYEHEMCGVALGNGSICKETPSTGTKRCEVHKGKKILGTKSSEVRRIIPSDETTTKCGIVLEDGSPCSESPIQGRKRCALHKGRRLLAKPSKSNITESLHTICHPQPVQEETIICGVINNDGSTCRKVPVSGRKRCKGHKGQRIIATTITLEVKEDMNICGVVHDGDLCKAKPVSGRKRCEEHKGMRISLNAYVTNEVEDKLLVCGVDLGDSTICRQIPVPGRKRCAAHKGRKAK